MKRLCLTHHVTTKDVIRKDLTILDMSHPDWDFYYTHNHIVTQNTLIDICGRYRFCKYDCSNDITITSARVL